MKLDISPMPPERVRAIRTGLELSASELARRLGCSRAALRRWESIGTHGRNAAILRLLVSPEAAAQEENRDLWRFLESQSKVDDFYDWLDAEAASRPSRPSGQGESP